MKTIILPGYSEHNKVWAKEFAQRLAKKDLVVITHFWRHWSEAKAFSLEYEVDKIIDEIGDNRVNIVAKSVGVWVALNLIPRIADKVNKVIFCGIASVKGKKKKELLRLILKSVPLENILCIQNEKDKFVPFEEAQKFYHSVEPKLKVISKPRSDHDYPFYEDFESFFGS